MGSSLEADLAFDPGDEEDLITAEAIHPVAVKVPAVEEHGFSRSELERLSHADIVNFPLGDDHRRRDQVVMIERAFREVRRRTRVVGRFPNELAALTLVFATLEQDRLKWRGVRMDDELRAEIDSARQTAMEKSVFTIGAVDSYLEAA